MLFTHSARFWSHEAGHRNTKNGNVASFWQVQDTTNVLSISAQKQLVTQRHTNIFQIYWVSSFHSSQTTTEQSAMAHSDISNRVDFALD